MTTYLLLQIAVAASALTAANPFPEFKEHVINAEAGTGLAITVTDINQDGQPDIVGVSSKDVAWYENPTWERHLISDTLRNSNVCVAAHDVDGDGIPELAVGADWQYNNTTSGGALFLLHHGGDVKALWKSITLVEEEPTLHRVRWVDFEGHGQKALVVAPLKGVDSTGPEFTDSAVFLYALFPGENPLETPWRRETISNNHYLVHNIWAAPQAPGLAEQLFIASGKGVFARYRKGKDQYISTYNGARVFSANNSVGLGGAGEIKTVLSGTQPPRLDPVHIIATIEPMHGHQAVLYTPSLSSDPFPSHQRLVLDDQLKGGHAIGFADFDRDGDQDLLVGFREKAGPKNLPGLNIYYLSIDRNNTVTSRKQVVDDGGMATEDALAHDMNGDGWPDIVAFGRATHNIKYYENLGKGE